MVSDSDPDADWNIERFRQEINRIVADELRLPPEQRLKHMKEELAKMPEPYEKAGETLVLQTEATMNATNHDHETPLWEKIAIFTFGVVFLVILLGIAVLIPNPTEFQIFVFRVVLSLVAAAIAALVPGFLHIQSQVYRNSIRAGGAIAVFVLVYLINPPRLVTSKEGSGSRLDESRAIAVLSVQFEEIQKISELFDGKTEGDLREEFGFNQMFKRNVDWLFARYRHSSFKERFNDNAGVLALGVSFKILEGGGGTVERETGKFTPEKSDRIVTLLIIPERFEKTTSVLRKFGDSAFLTEETRNLIHEYIALADANAIILGDVLDEAARELPRRYPRASDKESDVWINNRWVDRFKNLGPKAREIQENLRRYVKAG
jgi:hypothetical protein